MTLPLHSSIVRFWRPTKNGRVVAGTGFFAAGVGGTAYALTCAHVANLAAGRSKDATEPLTLLTTTADLVGRGEVTLDLVAWFAPPPLGQTRPSEFKDIAVFAPCQRPSLSFIPHLRLEPPGRVVPPGARLPFQSFGFSGMRCSPPGSNRSASTRTMPPASATTALGWRHA